MIGVDTIPPKAPRLVMVMVDPLSSSSVILSSAPRRRDGPTSVGAVPQVDALRVPHDRNHQALGGLRGDAEVDRAMPVDDTVLVVVSRR